MKTFDKVKTGSLISVNKAKNPQRYLNEVNGYFMEMVGIGWFGQTNEYGETTCVKVKYVELGLTGKVKTAWLIKVLEFDP